MVQKHRVGAEICGKKGATISGWFEAVGVILAVVFCFTLIIADMNDKYSMTNSLPLSNQTNSYINNLTAYSSSAKEQMASGTTQESTLLGIYPLTYWAVLKAGFLILFDIIVGNWIPTLMSNAFYGFAGALVVGQLLQAIWIIGLILAIIRVFTKVRP